MISFRGAHRHNGRKYENGREVLVEGFDPVFFSSYQVDWFGEEIIREAILDLLEWELDPTQEAVVSQAKVYKSR